jgi:uncharacterized protein YdeI (YjbR/CyaY-like superfamily)
MAEPPRNSVHPKSRAEWREWLGSNHGRAEGVWLISSKKAAGGPEISYDEAVEEALCFGCVDRRPAKLDDRRSRLDFSPRKPRSGWSAPNKGRVERATAAGLMTPVGLAKVEAAKADGSWRTLDAVEALEVPEDLAAALSGLVDARRKFDASPRSVRRGILEWIVQAKRPETRARRVEETARLAAENRRANRWRG